MWHNGLHNHHIDIEFEDDDGTVPYPVFDHSKPRGRFKAIDNWDFVEMKDAGRYHKHQCWKEQTKNSKQWAKHKQGCSNKNLHYKRMLKLAALEEYDTFETAPFDHTEIRFIL